MIFTAIYFFVKILSYDEKNVVKKKEK
jgi:hypothetical protein